MSGAVNSRNSTWIMYIPTLPLIKLTIPMLYYHIGISFYIRAKMSGTYAFRSTGWSEHLGQVTHFCVGNLTIIGLDNGLSPGRRQAIIGANDEILLIGPVKTKRLKALSAKWRPLPRGRNVLTHQVTNDIIFLRNSYIICCYNFHLQRCVAWLTCVLLNETEVICLMTTIALDTIQLQIRGHIPTTELWSNLNFNWNAFVYIFCHVSPISTNVSHTTASAHNCVVIVAFCEA